MRPIYVTVSAVGPSAWIPINYLQNSFGIGFGVTLSSDGSLTYSVQHTFDDTSDDANRFVSVSRAGTTATVTDTAHKLSTGDSVIITGASEPTLNGTFTITVTGVNAYTYTTVASGTVAATMYTQVKSFRVFDHEDVVAKVARTDGNYAFPPRAIRLNVTSYSAGSATLAILQGLGI